ncbi:MAG: hypothetical protein ACO1SX_19505, partial [Actinomycetota bacterium]
MGRELIFSNPEIAGLITERFVAYAGDQWYLHRQKDSLGAYFWKVAQQGHNGKLPEDSTRQGVYVADPDGALLASDHFRPDAAAFLAMLNRSLKRAAEAGREPSVISGVDAPDVRYSRIPPVDGLILNAFTRIPQEGKSGAWTPNQAVARDHVWLTKAEAAGLRPTTWKKDARMAVPRAIAERIARFHLVDNVRGEPPMWTRNEIRELDLSVRVVDPAAG